MLIKVKAVFLEDKIISPALIRIEDGHFVDIRHLEGQVSEREKGEDYYDFGDYIMVPGFVDTHIHGFDGFDIMDAKAEGLEKISRGIAKNGVTSFLPTGLTASRDQLNEACRVVGENYKKLDGAKVRGFFLEGPFFTEKYKGAQNPAYFSDPDIGALKKWKDLSGGLVNKIAIAAERAGVEEFIKEAKDMGVYVALGHSDATYAQACSALDAGANIFVHCYNAMSPLHHREPGMVGAAIFRDDSYAELICDGHHVHPASAGVVIKAKGYEKVALITDCMMAGGLEDGMYKLGEFDVRVKDGTARLESGSLAGSVLKMNDAVKNVYDWQLASKFQAVQMASLIPAKSVGIDGVCGKIALGYEADFNLLNDDMSLYKTFINGLEIL